ncbi:MAG: alpha/beta hydrolase [Chloroflexi bacterium]|uniref:Alpha/beta hydrolase n=1 Tax=Candidatus Chlorohelix allophototropha TaxID=3003348 RepID=A0A8T7LX42_9CHLR|nr:alpha/beta hydrolase [Chloroflexota bacterium]WJW66646.1 alpha/beta hydrolase [Chloroflexota bacterium L227-S17]
MAENNIQSTVVLRDGVKLNYRKWSALDNNAKINTPFLLLHGLASGSRIWDKVATELLKITSAPVYALDQRGHGLSDKPDSGYTTAQIVEDVHSFAESQNLISERPVIVGHSWGATIALAYAATYPDYVSGVALVDGGMGNMRSRPGMDNWEEVAKRLAPPEFAGTPRQTFLDYFRKGGQARFIAPVWDAQLEEMVLNIVELREDDTVAPRLSRQNHMQILRSMWESDNLAHAANIHSPVLMISAEPTTTPDMLPEDEQQAGFIKMKREGAEQLKAALVSSPKVEFIIMSETIHDIPLQRPVELVKLFSQFFFTRN